MRSKPFTNEPSVTLEGHYAKCVCSEHFVGNALIVTRIPKDLSLSPCPYFELSLRVTDSDLGGNRI